MTKKEKKKMLVIFSCFFLFTGVLATYCYFQSSNAFQNKFYTGSYDVSLEEEFYYDWGTKVVCVSNSEEATTPAVIRLNYNEVWSNNVEGGISTLSNNVNGENVVDKEWTSTFLNDFILADDGWYYYKKVLNVGEKVCILNSVSLKEDLISQSEDYEKYMSFHYELDFNYEASQATLDAIRTIWGHSAEINESGEIEWEL